MKTNFDKIKEMDVEELASFLRITDCDSCPVMPDEPCWDCAYILKQWLESEVENDKKHNH